ncbi:retrovirus-related pol polyprotein from transposon TNT 1-94 [Tanacetum coccineum]|uniref:Retrovirus-related pol polyprotein from transposon TNT 1-94 n=1 Tax=Tanacetum coccineum TaxID=301880 RepID=A0ABQ5ISB7_9ASTR
MESASEEDSAPNQAQKDNDMQEDLALIAKTGQFGNEKAVNVVGARETVGGPVVQQFGIQCFNCKEFGHYAKECRNPKRVKDSTYHKEKMLMCKQAEKGVQLQAEQSDWLADTDEEIDEQELEAHYSYMAKIQEDDQNDVECDDERAALANLIAFNDRTVDYDKLEHKLNEALGLLAQKEIDIKEGLKVKACEISIVKEKHDELVKQSLLTKSHYEGLVKEKTKVITDLKLKEEKDIDKMISMENQIKFLNEIVYKRSQSIQTIHMLAPKCPTFNGRTTSFAIKMLCGSYLQSSSALDEITEFDQCLDVVHVIVREWMTDKAVEMVDSTTMPSAFTWVPKTKSNGLLKLGTRKVLLEFVQLIHIHADLGRATKHMRAIYLWGGRVQGISRSKGFTTSKGNNLLTGNRGSDLYKISLQETSSSSSILMSTIYYVTSVCVSKAKQSSFKSKTVPSSKGRLNLLHMDLCGPMQVASINGKKFILVIVDDYSRYTWTLFLRSKDETPEVLKHFLTMIQRNLQALVISVRTDRGTEFLNKTLNAFFKEEGIKHKTSTPRTPE